MSDIYLDHYLFDNSKVYLQEGDKPPKGAIIHKGPKDGRYYDPDERPVQYVHISPERQAFLSWLESQGSAGFDTQKDIDGLPDEVSYKRGYRDRFEIGKEIQALERIGILYRDGDTYHLSDDGKRVITQDGEIRVIDRIKREEHLNKSPFRDGLWNKQDLKGLTKYVNVPTYGLTEKYPPNFGKDLAEYTKFKTAGLVDHQPYTYYIMDEVIEHSYSDNEILKYCGDNSDEFDEIYAKEGRAYVLDEIRKAHDAIRLNKHDEVDLSSPVIKALIKDRIIGKNDCERIVLTEAGKTALKDGKYEFSLPKTQIQQSITNEALLGIDKNKYPVSDYFIKTNTDITPIEMQSIIEYKANWYDAVNRALLRGTEPIQEETNNMIACLDNLLSRSVIKEACTLYNGCPTEVSNMMLSGEFSAGDILQLDTFTSTSLDREVAGMFSNNDVILKIEQPANSTGFFYGTEETEQEVLLPRGTQLRIKEIRKVPRFHEFYGGLEKDGSLTWDTLTDDEKDQALDDGYCEVPTKEHNFDTLSPEDQQLMGKTIVVCDRLSGINTLDPVQADNSYRHYLTDGEQPKAGEQVHKGPRNGRWVNREERTSEVKPLKPYHKNSNIHIEQIFEDPTDEDDPYREVGLDQPIPEGYKDRIYYRSITDFFSDEEFEPIKQYVEKVANQGYVVPPESKDQKDMVDFALKSFRIAESHTVYQVLSKEVAEEVLKNLNNSQGMISLGDYSLWSNDNWTVCRTIRNKAEDCKTDGHIDFPERLGIPKYYPDAIIVEYELGSGSEGICAESYDDYRSYLVKNHDNYIVTDMEMVDGHDSDILYDKHVLKLTVRKGFSGTIDPVPEDIIPRWTPKITGENTNTMGQSYFGTSLQQYEQNYNKIINEITELYGDIPEGMKSKWDKFGAREDGLVCIRDKSGKPSCILTGVRDAPNFALDVDMEKQVYYLSDSGKQDLMDWLPQNLNRFDKVNLYTSPDNSNVSTYMGWGMSETKHDGNRPFNVYSYEKTYNTKGKDKADITLPNLVDVPIPSSNSTCNIYDAIDSLDISRNEKEKMFARFMNVWKRSFTGYQYAREIIQGNGDFKNIRKNHLALHPEDKTIWEQLHDIGSSFPQVKNLEELMHIFDSGGYVGMTGYEIVVGVKDKMGGRELVSIPIKEQEQIVREVAQEAYRRNEKIKFPPDPLPDEDYADLVDKYNRDNVFAEDTIKMVDSIFAHARSPKDAQIYRGIGYDTIIDIFGTDDTDELNKHIGEEIYCPFYTSWTDDLPNAVYYSLSSEPKQPNRMFVSDIKKGEHAIYMSPTPDMIQGEQEIVIGRNARYIFKGVSKMRAKDQSGSEYDIVTYNIEPVRE